eukprot:CAMPEP_0183485590 /NCGR_PEP_ID=MMETSP0370-20130417/179504_1 /TAXON_ID=268820 /ORGANISM="Peridinium aciculiferum, Strain PAER-2" /LENGTH=449 /DNA_ID=CAMNT_0025678895 /DNA_START=193 /DNA_END=1540 /DNA_ORIENTATION=+
MHSGLNRARQLKERSASLHEAAPVPPGREERLPRAKHKIEGRGNTSHPWSRCAPVTAGRLRRSNGRQLAAVERASQTSTTTLTMRSLRRRALPAARAPTGVLAPATALAAAIGSCTPAAALAPITLAAAPHRAVAAFVALAALALALALLRPAGAAGDVDGHELAVALDRIRDVEGQPIAGLGSAAVAVLDVQEDVLAVVLDESPALLATVGLHGARASAGARRTLAAALGRLRRARATLDVRGVGLAGLVVHRDIIGDDVTLVRSHPVASADVHEDILSIGACDEAKALERVVVFDGARGSHGGAQALGSVCGTHTARDRTSAQTAALEGGAAVAVLDVQEYVLAVVLDKTPALLAAVGLHCTLAGAGARRTLAAALGRFRRACASLDVRGVRLAGLVIHRDVKGDDVTLVWGHPVASADVHEHILTIGSCDEAKALERVVVFDSARG